MFTLKQIAFEHLPYFHFFPLLLANNTEHIFVMRKVYKYSAVYYQLVFLAKFFRTNESLCHRISNKSKLSYVTPFVALMLK